MNIKENLNQLQQTLTPIQYQVTQENGTEKPFANPYYNNKTDGIYVDIVSGEVLFSSKDKYDSSTGWPSFTQPIQPSHITEKVDMSLRQVRTEVRSTQGDSHLGHVCEDGPPQQGGRCYCINSAALKFIPKEQMQELGYGDYLDEV